VAEPSGTIERLVRPAIRGMRAYHVADPGRLIKLDAMENPYPWPPSLVTEWLKAVGAAQPNRYPDASAGALKKRLCRELGVPEQAGLILGNGSDELIQLLGMALGGEGRSVLSPGPSFAMYRIIAGFTGMAYHEVPLRGVDFSLDGDAFLAAIAEHQPTLIYLAYPNNPTGNRFDAALIDQILDVAPGVVVLDEAYHAFCGASYMDQLIRRPNLMVMRTVSKMGLAGLRLGYMATHPDWAVELEKCRLPYNVNVLTQISASFALDHVAVFNEQTACIRRDREVLHKALVGVKGLQVWPSEANFITFRVSGGGAGVIHRGLMEQGVLIKNLDGSHPLLKDCLRVTVGTPQENERFLEALEGVLAG
jgi:histidinol-phosphate aminotransferase